MENEMVTVKEGEIAESYADVILKHDDETALVIVIKGYKLDVQVIFRPLNPIFPYEPRVEVTVKETS